MTHCVSGWGMRPVISVGRTILLRLDAYLSTLTDSKVYWDGPIVGPYRSSDYGIVWPRQPHLAAEVSNFCGIFSPATGQKYLLSQLPLRLHCSISYRLQLESGPICGLMEQGRSPGLHTLLMHELGGKCNCAWHGLRVCPTG